MRLSGKVLRDGSKLSQKFKLAQRGGPQLVRVLRHPQAIPQYELGHADRVCVIEERVRRLPGLHLTGNPYRGVSLSDVAGDALRVAARVATTLGRSSSRE